MDIGYIRPLPRHSEAKQRSALELVGVKRIYVEGNDGEGLAEATKALRKGDTFYIMRLAFLTAPKRTTRDSPRANLFRALQAIEARGAVVYETAGYLNTAHGDRDAMLLSAVEWLSGQIGVNGHKTGRPPAQFPADVVDKAKGAWLNIRYRTEEQAAQHLPAGFSRWRCRRLFGPRLRAPD